MMHSHRYDRLRDTWIYQEIKQEVEDEEAQKLVSIYRQALLTIVQARFPRLLSLAEEVSACQTDPESLFTLLIKTGAARLEKEVRQQFLNGWAD